MQLSQTLSLRLATDSLTFSKKAADLGGRFDEARRPVRAERGAKLPVKKYFLGSAMNHLLASAANCFLASAANYFLASVGLIL